MMLTVQDVLTCGGVGVECWQNVPFRVMSMGLDFLISEGAFLTGSQADRNKKKRKKISCEHELTLLSVSVCTKTLYIAAN